MLIVRFIFSILFAPIRILGNLFHHRDNLLEWHLTHDQYLVLIQSKYREEKKDDHLLIASYILFLSRYFYICDDRQIAIVRNILQEQVRGQGENINNITEKIYIAIFHTLKPEERKVVGRLYSGGTPPLKYSEDWPPMNPNTKYSFLVFENKGILNENLHLSHGPDIILLPITVGILYEYVSDSFINVNSREKLNKVINDLLEAHNQLDCRSLKVFKELPLEILSRNNIRYSSAYAETALAQTAEEYFDKGVTKAQKGNHKGAIQDYRRAIELNPNYADAYNNRGNAKSKLGDYKEAIQDFNKAIELNPKIAEAYLGRGNAKDELGDYKGAIQDCNKAIELNPKDAYAYHNRGNAKLKLGDSKSAIQDYNKAIELNPNLAEAYINRGVAKRNLSDNKGAIKDYNKAIEIDPNNALSYINRGTAKLNLGDHKGAIQDYNKAIEKNPNLAGAYYNRGRAKHLLSDYSGAIQDYNKAIEKNPNLAEAYNNRGIVKIQLGQKDSGCLDLSKAGEMGTMQAYDLIEQLCQ